VSSSSLPLRAGILLLLGAALIALPLSFRKTSAPPPAPRVFSRSVGPADAPIQIVEYSNFACPSCRHAQPMVKALLRKYEGRVLYTFQHFPWVNDSKSIHAHAAAQCAAAQGKFWPMHDWLFESQGVWRSPMRQGNEVFLEEAAALGLDPAAFGTCMEATETFQQIQNEWLQGQALGVVHTPTLFIQDRMFVGPEQLEAGAELWIEELLKKGK